ncbi:50S ribosomal protein L17 [Candidatus Zinderia endosymbiont of Aphrophora alni]|uniref:50S ribosomal protein L17 n=1 Tax=Candidatus Zinderia endosymbiont of Aphrophora alni TaxID=3077951 RepID=UPI0030CC8823
MRHLHNFRKLNRTSSHRLAMLRNMSISLIKNQFIKTTLSKAKELRKFIEPLLTLSKKDTLSNRRLIFNRLRNKNIVKKIFNELSIYYKNIKGGYLRILKFGYRFGDNASLAFVELINNIKNKKKLIKK